MAATRSSSDVAALLTAAAIGTFAAVLAVLGHETIGHGGACLLAGGHIVLLNIVDFRCSATSPWIDLAGPFGNLVLALVGLSLAARPPGGRSDLRLLGLCLLAFDLFWIAGYLLYAGVLGEGDYAYPLSLLMPESLWRAVATLLGAGLYLVGMRAMAMLTPPAAARPFRWAYLSASLAIVAAAALYVPAPLHTMKMAALEFPAAAFGAWWAMRNARGTADWTPPTSKAWWIVGALALLALAAVQGPGLPR